MSQLRSIVVAHGRSTWNRAYRESGLAAGASAGLLVVLVGIVLLPLFGLATRISLQLARSLGGTDRSGGAVLWLTVFLAVDVVLFGVIGGLRHQLRLPWNEFGRYPISRARLLIAELPAGAIEVMPLIALPLILGYGTGLILGQPRAAPAIVLMTVQALVWLLLVQHLTGSLKRLLFKRSGVSVAAIAGVLAVVALGAWLVRSGPEGWWMFTPGAQAHQGIAEIAQGRLVGGWMRQLIPLLWTAFLLGAVARVHYREMTTERRVFSRGSPERGSWRFRTPAQGVGRLFVSEILGSRWGRTMVLMPAFLVGIAVMVQAFVVAEPVADNGVEAALQQAMHRLADLPLFAIALVLVPLLNADIWLNQFGWDRRGVCTLLTVPIELEAVLFGKLRGATMFACMQAVLVVLPVLWLRAPSWPELCAGVGAAGTVLIWTMGIGHVFSARFPRAVRRDAAGPAPKSLLHNLVALMVTLPLVAGLAIPAVVLSGTGAWAVAIVMIVMMVSSTLAYGLALPTWAGAVRLHQECLVTQLGRGT